MAKKSYTRCDICGFEKWNSTIRKCPVDGKKICFYCCKKRGKNKDGTRRPCKRLMQVAGGFGCRDKED